MYQSKLITQLKLLSAEDLAQFENFLISPYCNRNKKVVDLFALIKPFAPDYNDLSLNKDTVFAKLFSDKSSGGSNLTQLMSQLGKLLKDFLAYENYRRHPYNKQLALMQELADRNNMGGLKEELKTLVLPSLGDSRVQDADLFYCHYTLQGLNFTYHIRTHNRDTEAPLMQLTDCLDTYILVLKLRSMVSILSRQRVLNQQYSLRWCEIVKDANMPPFNKVALIQFYNHIVHILQGIDVDEHYNKLRALLRLEAHQIEYGELLQIYSICLNHELRLVKEDTENIHSIVELCQEMEQNRLFDKHIQNVVYTSVVKFASQVGEYQWADSFMATYKDKIAVDSPEERDYTYNYSRAIWHFYKGEHKKAKYLLGQNYPDAYYYAERKTFLMKIYYYLEEEDELTNEVKAVKAYLSRDKIMTNYNKESMENFTAIIAKLNKLKNKTQIKNHLTVDSTIAEFDALEKHIREIRPIYDLTWVNSAFAELKKNNLPLLKKH